MGLGLAIGLGAMRACEAWPGWQGLRLGWCGAAPLPGDLMRASPREENIASVAGFRRHLTEVFQGRWLLHRLQVGLPDTSVRVRLLFADELPQPPAERRKFLLWRLADALDARPERSRLAYMVRPSPLAGHRYAVLCAVSAEKVVQQYERALAESRIRYAGLAPGSVLLFNLFHRQLVGPPGAPVLFLAATEEAVTTVLTVEGCPVFWRSHALARSSEAGQTSPTNWRGELLRDVTDAIGHAGDRLGLAPPGRLLGTGPPMVERGLADWLSARLARPVVCLDAGRLVKRVARRIAGEGWSRWGVALGAATRQC